MTDERAEAAEPAYLFGPLFQEMRAPESLSEPVREAARIARASDPFDPINLFNLHWEDDLGEILAVVLPPQLTGVTTPIVVLVGGKFPLGSMKTGPAYAVLAEKQAFVEIDPGRNRLVVPSTGSFGAATAWVGTRLGYSVHVVLPEDASHHHVRQITQSGATYVRVTRERSSLSSVFSAARAASEDESSVLIDPWAEFASYRFHATVTASAIEKLVRQLAGQGIGRGKVSAFVSVVGTGGSLGSGAALRDRHGSIVVAVEPLGASQLFDGGFGAHRARDSSTELVPWILDTASLDAVACVSDLDALRLLALVEECGPWLSEVHGIREDNVSRLRGMLGVSGAMNVLGAIKTVKRFGLTTNDIVVTLASENGDADASGLEHLSNHDGPADRDLTLKRLEMLHRVTTDAMLEGRENRRRWHNQKYHPWVEMRGKSAEALEAQRSPEFWKEQRERVFEIDRRIASVRPSFD